MASKYLQKFPVPQGFQEILSDFTKEVLREQPPNILQFAAQYFETLEKGRKMDFGSARKIDGVSSKDAEDMTKRASNIASKIGDVVMRQRRTHEQINDLGYQFIKNICLELRQKVAQNYFFITVSHLNKIMQNIPKNEEQKIKMSEVLHKGIISYLIYVSFITIKSLIFSFGEIDQKIKQFISYLIKVMFLNLFIASEMIKSQCLKLKVSLLKQNIQGVGHSNTPKRYVRFNLLFTFFVMMIDY